MSARGIGGSSVKFSGPAIGLTMAISVSALAGCGGPLRSVSATTRPTAASSSTTTAASSSTTTAASSSTTTRPTAPTPTGATTSTTGSSAPTLGLAGAWFAGSGFGEVEPSTVFLGGDPTGQLTSIHWSSWGGAEATGSGIGWYVPPNVITAKGSDEPATVVAFDLGTCADRPAYQEVTWYFTAEGETFDPSQAQYACTEGYVSQGTEAEPYSPWATATQLFGDIMVVNTLSGTSCTGVSAFDVNDQYAWRCTVQGGRFYDPCFAPGPPQLSDVTEVACADNPWSGVTLIKLSQPLANSSWGIPTDNLRHPWALQLVNGEQCGLIEGTGSVVNGVTLNYGCTHGDAAYPSENVEPWKTLYSLDNSEKVGAYLVARAWS
jgi:hypothetical protein